nr:reverse transcriptase domain-containing protein [Tanacetum cinerariifolium]
MPRECLKIIESKSKVRQSRAKAVVAKVSTSSSTPAISSEVAELKDLVRALLLDKKNQSSALAVEPNCVTCGGTHSYQNCPATSKNVYRDNIQEYVSQAAAANYNQGNTAFQPQMVVNQPPAYQAPIPQTQSVSNTDFKSYIKANDAILRNMQSQGQRSGTLPSNTITNPKKELKGITTRSSVVYRGPTIPTPSKQGTKCSDANVKSSIPYPSRHDNERRRDQANEQIEKFYEIFKDMSFEISFTDDLILMPKFASTLKALIRNKEKLSEMARTLMKEHCSVVILNKLPRKIGDPSKFLIPCEFPGMDECLALTDLGASINLMPLSVWEALSLPKLTSTCMTLELADRSVSKPIGITKDVSFKTGRALIDVHKGELTLCIRNEAITYNLDQTVRYSANYNQMTTNKIDVIEMACEEYSQEVLGFSDVTTSGNPTPHDDLIISTTSPTLTPFGDNDFLLFEEVDAFLELKVCEEKIVKSSVDEPPEVELKDLSPHLECAFLEGDNKLPVIISKELGDEEKSALIKALKSYNIAWKLSDIQGIYPEFYTHKILMEEDYKPAVQHQRRVNPKIYDIIKKEVEKLFDTGLIYPISDSPWVSPVHYVPKKGGFTVVKNEENELIPTRLVTRWRVCIDYRKLNEATRKYHFPLPFMDQMLERLAGNEFYCFLDGFSGYFEIPIDPRNQEKTTYMLAIFHDMVEKTMEVFMDEFSVFGNSFENCLSRLGKMLQRCEDTNLSLNWEKSHFMVIEGIVLGHKISKNGTKVDRAKVDVIAKLPHPTTIKVLLLQEFDFKVLDTKEVENLAADHLSRLENPYENMLDPKGINETFPLETLSMVTFRGDSSASWFADFANYQVEAKALPTNDARVVCKFLKSLFARFGAPRAIISDRGTHFCNEQFAKVMLKYGVTHRLSTAYHPQTSGQVEVSNRGLKRILARTIGENRASWSDKLDDALWAFRTAYKTPIGCTSYKLVYGKACHLLIEIEHKAYWALKQANFDLAIAGNHQKIQLNELNEIRDHAYENSLIYKEKTKRIHDSKIKNRVFNVGDRVLISNSRLKIFLGKLKTAGVDLSLSSKFFHMAKLSYLKPTGQISK